METIRLDFLLEAEQPICHLEETRGNIGLAMRRKIRLPDGSWSNVPCISGDTMRHGLRAAAAHAYLDAAGLHGNSLTEAALRLLFAGGMITGSAGGSVKLGDYREMCDLFPPLALLGGCAQNRCIPGRMTVTDATLLCEETRHRAPAWAAPAKTQLDGARRHIENVQRVRMDPSLDPAKQALLIEDQRAETQARLIASETASESDDAVGKDKEKSSMMPRRFERIAEGSLFFWSVSAHCMTELDRDTLFLMVGAFLHEAYVGGKRGTGHGRLRAIEARQCEVTRPADRSEVIEVQGLSGRVGDLFRSHVRERADRIGDFLAKVAA